MGTPTSTSRARSYIARKYGSSSLAESGIYVTLTGPAGRATAAGGCLKLATLLARSLEHRAAYGALFSPSWAST
jgi:hypothetical protein